MKVRNTPINRVRSLTLVGLLLVVQWVLFGANPLGDLADQAKVLVPAQLRLWQADLGLASFAATPASAEGTNDVGSGQPGVHTTAVGPWRTSPFSGPVNLPPAYNFGIVAGSMVYRSGQPTEAEYRWLAEHGFKSVVSLRHENGDQRDYILSLGFKNYLFLDIVDETIPTDEQAEQFLAFVTNPDNRPIVFHCKAGMGRTGTLAALIRYAVDGWTMDEALAEATLYRNGTPLNPAQVEWLQRWAANHPPACHHPIPPSDPPSQ